MNDCGFLAFPNLKVELLLRNFKDLSPETRSVLKKMDLLTLVSLSILPTSIIKGNLNPATNEDVTTAEIKEPTTREKKWLINVNSST